MPPPWPRTPRGWSTSSAEGISSWVPDPEGARICKLTFDSEEFVGEFGKGDFIWPVGLDLDQDGSVYASDEHLNVINIYDEADGQLVGKWGEAGSGEGQLNGAAGIAFDADDNLFVVDSLGDRVQKFTKDGRYLMGWGSSGPGEDQLRLPWGITIGKEGSVYVVDWGNDRVQKYSPDGEHLMTFGTMRDDGGELKRPADVAVDSEGDVYVSDWGNKRVQIYDPEGGVIAALYGDAYELSKAAQETVDANPDASKAYERVRDRNANGPASAAPRADR